VVAVSLEVLTTILRHTFTITSFSVKIEVAWAFLNNTVATTIKFSICGEKFFSEWADSGLAHAIAGFLVKNLASFALINDAFTAAPLDVPCFSFSALLW
jgi:hypothetical protein